MAMALHYTHTLRNAVSAWMVLYYFLELFSNNCYTLFGSDLTHKSHLLSTESNCVDESDYSVHNMTECTLRHVHSE